jgi:predicted tellurium resistance membrane protein TerC
MEFLLDPHVWLSFLTLALLEIVLGIDNIILLSVLVGRLPVQQRKSARLLGLGFAMLTRLALLFSITWLTTLRKPLFAALGADISGRDLILFGGGLFLVVNSVLEVREMLKGGPTVRKAALWDGFWLIIAQIGLIDVVFSLDSVFTAVGLSNQIEVMVAAIVASVAIMMFVSNAVGTFIDSHPTIKVLALVFLVLVGGELMAESAGLGIPSAYLYVAMAVSAVVELINLRIRRPPA